MRIYLRVLAGFNRFANVGAFVGRQVMNHYLVRIEVMMAMHPADAPFSVMSVSDQDFSDL